MPTEQECRKIIFNIGLKLGVSPKSIATRLLGKEDKEDMMSGRLSGMVLEEHVKVWKENGFPDYCFKGVCEGRGKEILK